MKDIYVYGPIGEDAGHGSISANQFAWLMQQANGDAVTVHVNSGGGDVFAANAMAETIRQYKGETVASIEGLAASAASYFALTADSVQIAPSALLMIHNPWGVCMGESGEMRKTADMLDVVKRTITLQYSKKTGMTEKEIGTLMDDETWFSAEDALKLGFCDGYTQEDAKIAACVDQKTIDGFKNAPKGIEPFDGVKPSNPETVAAEGESEDAAGDAETTIAGTNEIKPEAEAAEGAAEAAARIECVNGRFIKRKE